MPVGIDFGSKGGMVALNNNHAVFAKKTPIIPIKWTVGESDKAKERGEKSKAKTAKPRYVRNGELKPKTMTLFDNNQIMVDLMEVKKLAKVMGYSEPFILLEEPQTLIGKSHIKTYYSSGRCQNAWLLPLHKLNLPFRLISPISWKRTMKLTSNKADSISLANASLILPDYAKKDHDLCEAALLAHYLQLHASRYLENEL